MKVSYIRVSTKEQNTERQRMILEKYGIEKEFEEKVSGKNADRPKLAELRNFVREGDIVFVCDLSRLARNLNDLLEITQEFQQKKVQLVSAKESIDTTTPTGRLIFHMIASICEFERDIIHERQAEGIAVAKAQGKNIGRPHKKFNQELFLSLYKQYQQRLITITKIADELHISRATVYRLIGEQQNQSKE